MNSKLFAVSGYLLAAGLLCIVLQQSQEIENLKENIPALPPAPKSATSKSSSATPQAVLNPNSLSDLLADPRDAALLSSLGEIDAAAIPGQPNQRLIEAADHILLDSDYERRTRNFGILLSKLRPEDCLAMQEQFVRLLQDGRGFGDEYRLFSTLWGKLDAVTALDLYMNAPHGDYSPHELHNVLKGWASHNPAAALAWVEAHPDFTNKGVDPLAAVYRGWARKDVAAATASMLEKCTQPKQQMEAARFIYFEALASQGFNASLGWLKNLPVVEKGAGGLTTAVPLSIYASICENLHLGGSTPEQMTKTWLSLGDAPWFGLDQFEQLIQSCRRGREPMMEQFSSPATRPALQEQFLRWSATDPDATGNWLNSNTTSPLYDPAAVSLARSLAPSDPTAAQAWAETIRDPALRAQAYTSLRK